MEVVQKRCQRAFAHILAPVCSAQSVTALLCVLSAEHLLDLACANVDLE
jgi:hypothetical protein